MHLRVGSASLQNGYAPTMEPGDIVGHEPMGMVVDVGKAVSKLKTGDRVVVPFTISCGTCWFCQRQLYSLCDSSNPNAELSATGWASRPAGLFGFSHMLGGLPGRPGRELVAYRTRTWACLGCSPSAGSRRNP